MTELMEWLYQASANDHLLKNNYDNICFILYAVAALMTKEVAYLAAFFIACCIISLGNFSELEVYLLDLILYSELFFYAKLNKTKLACFFIMLVDAGMITELLYAKNQTFMYDNIEHFALLTHLLLICSILHFDKFKRALASFFNAVCRFSHVNYFFVVYWYNVYQIHKTHLNYVRTRA